MSPVKFGIIFAAFAALFIIIGWVMAILQQIKLTTYQPIAATVLGTSIEYIESSGSDHSGGPTYEPIVRYRYDVAGQSYEANQVRPTGESASHEWAQQIISHYTKGQKVTAYYNPKNPSKAFLEPVASFFPYIFILFPMIHFCVGIGAILKDRMRRSSLALLLGIIWYAVGAAAIAHFLSIPQAKMDLTARISIWTYLGLGLIPLLIWAHAIMQGGIGGQIKIDESQPQMETSA
jgi:hypothetical protein